MPVRLAVAFALLALPLAAAIWAAGNHAAASEAERADARVASSLRAAAAQYVALGARVEQRASRAAAEPSVHRAFADRDARALARLDAARPGIELALGSDLPAASELALSRTVEVAVGGRSVGVVRASRRLDARLLADLGSGAGLPADVRLAFAAADGRIVTPQALAGGAVAAPGRPGDVRLGGADYRAAAVVLPGTSARLVALTPQDGIAASERRARRSILVAGLVTLLSVAVIAYLLAPAFARARVGRQQREQAARVLDHVGDGVCLVDQQGLVRIWNPAAEAVTGLSAAAVLDRPAVEAIPGWRKLELLVPVGGSPGEAGGAGTVTVPLELDGRELWLSISGVRFSDGTVYAFRDLTEERRLEDMRSELVATVSHELRTPLASIHGAAMTLRRRDAPLDEATRDQLLRIVTEQSNRLSRLADDVLLASRLGSGDLPLRDEPVDGEAIVREAVEAARAQAPAGPAILLRVRSRPRVRGDVDKLRQVLASLLDNAIKYSPPSGTIEVGVERSGERARLFVRDEGIGVPASERERIFEKFFRLDPQLSRGVGGSGLGLYISRELVRRMGGRIWVESERGRGSTFFVELPLADEPAASAA